MTEWIYDPKANRCRKTDGGQAMSDDMTNLSPCPFCGGGETSIDEKWTAPDMSGKDSLIGVNINHWCKFAEPRPAQRLRIQVHGRDHADAIAAWNMREEEGKP